VCGYISAMGTNSSEGAGGEPGAIEDRAGEVTPAWVAERLRRGDGPALLDVREPDEWAIARLPDARLVPLNSLPQAVHSLDREAELVVYCHHGVRSGAAVAWLRGRGFTRVRNLAGGIDRWSLEVDPTVRRY
jgi:rhodanese-related sulfurtransferase